MRSPVRTWLALLRPGDVLVITAAAMLTWQLFVLASGRGPVDRAVIRRDGEIVAQVHLAVTKQLHIDGPLGVTRIDIEPGRARIAADPGTRQLCVRQGWLERANAVALCLPNHVSLQVVGSGSQHDSVAY